MFDLNANAVVDEQLGETAPVDELDPGVDLLGLVLGARSEPAITEAGIRLVGLPRRVLKAKSRVLALPPLPLCRGNATSWPDWRPRARRPPRSPLVVLTGHVG